MCWTSLAITSVSVSDSKANPWVRVNVTLSSMSINMMFIADSITSEHLGCEELLDVLVVGDDSVMDNCNQTSQHKMALHKRFNFSSYVP